MKADLKALGSNGTTYTDKYDPSQLEGFDRESRREEQYRKMFGVDIWTAYEVSFLKPNGVPGYLVLRLSNPAESKKIFESKSLKLYLNSFNNTVVESEEELIRTIKKDLSDLVEGNVLVEKVTGFNPESSMYSRSHKLEDYVKDMLVTEYQYNSLLLEVKNAKRGRLEPVELHSDLLRSNCEITGQPDWGRVYIWYIPGEVEVTYESLLKYIVSIRTHQMFHEPTCELIFQDLLAALKPKSLTVLCQYTRRGGIDINPIRSTVENTNTESIFQLPKLIQQ